MAIWSVPGAPLHNGTGWRLWYSRPGTSEFCPCRVTVQTLGRQPVAIESQTPQILPKLKGLSRRIALLDVKLKDPSPGKTFRVRIPELGRDSQWQTLPDRVASNGTSIILSSCFWQNDDEGHFCKAIQAVMKYETPRPAFKLLIGDQVYLDYPLALNPFSSPESVTAKRYEQYWGDSTYRDVMLSTPNFFMCDDHEYWNDYPETQIHLARSCGSDRDSYAVLSDQYYESFQLKLNASTKRWYTIDIDPVSFFVTDTRSQRDFFEENDPNSNFMTEQQWEDLKAWQQKLIGPGFLVLGQPLFQEDGDWKDHSLSNFRSDYRRLLKIIRDSFLGKNVEGKRHDIVILSGDIHTGRFARASVPIHGPSGIQFANLYELIASPSSRVGPFLSEPSPVRPPDRIPPSPTRDGRVRWRVSRSTQSSYFETVENNVGVLRLFPAERRPYKLRVEFVSYMVRPHRIPSWKIFSRQPTVGIRNRQQLRLNKNKGIQFSLL